MTERNFTTLVVGAGHAGLAMSKCLSERSIDHLVIERGRVANSWRTERWDSLRLLTPNWQSRLPGFRYDGDNPDGYRTMPEVIDFLDTYAQTIDAPVQTETTVTALSANGDGYMVETDKGPFHGRTVVVATGACNKPSVPRLAADIPDSITTLTPMDYRNPGQLENGGVLVVGASATGTQLADELHRSGRPVTLSVGEHVRGPRVYRGHDLQWWMDQAGVMDERYDEVDDIVRARRVPSIQLTGSPQRATLDLNALRAIGVKIIGRIAAIRGTEALFSGGLRNQCALADLKMNRLLNLIDEWATQNGLDDSVDPPHRLEPTLVEDNPQLCLNLGDGGIRTILWATGFKPDYSWLEVPVFDRKGSIRHDGGVTQAPGLYLMGMQFLRKRKSALIDGAGDDALALSAHLEGYLAGGDALHT